MKHPFSDSPGFPATALAMGDLTPDSNGKLAVGTDHACFPSEGQTWCWGSNRFGALGIDGGVRTIDEATPAIFP